MNSLILHVFVFYLSPRRGFIYYLTPSRGCASLHPCLWSVVPSGLSKPPRSILQSKANGDGEMSIFNLVLPDNNKNEQSQTYLNFVMARKRLMLIERWNHAQKNHVMRVKRASPRARRLVGMLFFNYSIGRHERVDDRPNGLSNSLHRAYQKSVGSIHRRCNAILAAKKILIANIQEHSTIGIVQASSPIISIVA